MLRTDCPEHFLRGQSYGSEFSKMSNRCTGEAGQNRSQIIAHRKLQLPTASTTERIAAISDPAWGLPTWI